MPSPSTSPAARGRPKPSRQGSATGSAGLDLADCDDAQVALDTALPGEFDVTSGGRVVWAYASDPTVPAVAIAQGDVAQDDYAMLATLALSAGINHLAIGVWIDGVYTPAELSGTLWAALDIVLLEVE
jgi:hypothetical protein